MLITSRAVNVMGREFTNCPLDEATFAAVWAEGRGMTMEHAIEEAMADATDSSK